jgi:hypothetical protein
VFLAGRIDIVPKAFPKEFRRDLIAVVRQGDQSIAAVVRNFKPLFLQSLDADLVNPLPAISSGEVSSDWLDH